LNIEVLEEIYQIINKLHKNNNISHETYKIIFNILKKKFEYVNIYILNPSLENLFKNEIFKLDISGEVVYIPLWHHEVNYNNNIIKIVPLLENNIFIDRDNNIHIKLYINKYQTYVFKNSGISQINLNNMFDVSNLSNIIVHIYLDV
jgi:hypothetical protein